ncbi:Heat shock protein DnaJ, cysteine-rich domain containing protein [Parasponia andersonii]|uniref:Heat shock protein DnaJ, cysteine-rich domain containing protein n=1 Tax=Parasponia andersonii TaxID=3476 RepID=A0A2P5DIS1_PARAD|nr:Heat shock protein DnaJ, cysteine-rich domain containing protein [Parasponia andersonii]
MTSCMLCRPMVVSNPIQKEGFKPSTRAFNGGFEFFVTHGINSRPLSSRVCGVRASMVDSYESSSNFIKRMEQTWLISQQPRPVACSSCDSKGHNECKWCAGTGFFILGDNMLCQVPSRNTTCIICAGKGSMCCSDCKGTGFRAKWLGDPPISK